MNVPQRFKVGDQVIAPSIGALNKQGGSSDDKYVPAVIIFAHPTNGWCSFRYNHSPVTASTFNDNIFFADEYEKRKDSKVKKALEELTKDTGFEHQYVDSAEEDDEPSPEEIADIEDDPDSDFSDEEELPFEENDE